MKKLLTLTLILAMVFVAFSTGYCKDAQRAAIEKNLTQFYNDLKTGNLEAMKELMTKETGEKVEKAFNSNVMGNLCAIFSISNQVNDGEAKVSITELTFDFKELIDDKAIVLTHYKMLIDAAGKEIEDKGVHEVVLVRYGEKWLIMNLTSTVEGSVEKMESIKDSEEDIEEASEEKTEEAGK